MDDKDLNTLKNIKVPEPNKVMKEAAVLAALDAFSEAEKKSEKKSQGVWQPLRLIFSFITNLWEWIMNRRVIIGAVATIVIVAPLSFGLYQFYNQDRYSSDLQELFPTSSDKSISAKSKKEVEVSILSKDNESKLAKPIDSRSSSQAQQKSVITRVEKKNAPGQTEIYNSRPIQEEARKVRPKRKEVHADGRRKAMLRKRPASEKQRMRVSIIPRRTAPRSDRNIVGLYSGGQISYNRPNDQLLVRPVPVEQNRDRFSSFESNSLKLVTEHPVSTFSIDVDTSSYAFVRRQLNLGRLPRKNAVRVEELINYFSYNYEKPATNEVPFKTNVAVFPTPWNKNTKLLHIGIKGYDVIPDTKPRSNLVFLIDISGSMQSKDKLPLLKNAFRLLVNQLEPEDRVAIVTYAGKAGTVLNSTKVSQKAKILNALERLQAGGSTAGAQGIRQAYNLAKENFDKEGINRVILATDGDFNVGITDRKELKNYIEKKRNSGIFLSVLGFGQGNYNDALMQTLAQNGNGTAAYIDTLREAQKALVEEASSTLFPIAKDVKIQIEFNPDQISEYRLIGYETRKLKREDFNNDRVDAGDIGSGHTITAIYEITPKGSPSQKVDDLRYRKSKPSETINSNEKSDEYAFVKLRYKLPKEDKSKLLSVAVTKEFETPLADLPEDTRFSTSVAAFGQKLRSNKYLERFSYDDVHKLASKSRGKDLFGYRAEFLSLVRLAKSLDEAKQ